MYIMWYIVLNSIIVYHVCASVIPSQRMYGTLILNVNSINMYMSMKSYWYKWTWETIQEYTVTQIKEKEEHLFITIGYLYIVTAVWAPLLTSIVRYICPRFFPLSLVVTINMEKN